MTRLGVKRCDCGVNIAETMKRCSECELKSRQQTIQQLSAENAALIKYINNNARCFRHEALGCECDGTVFENPIDPSRQVKAIGGVLEAANKWNNSLQDKAYGTAAIKLSDSIRKLKESGYE